MAESISDAIDHLKSMREQCRQALTRLDKIIKDIETAYANNSGFADNQAWLQFHESLLKRGQTISDEVEQIEGLLKEELILQRKGT